MFDKKIKRRLKYLKSLKYIPSHYRFARKIDPDNNIAMIYSLSEDQVNELVKSITETNFKIDFQITNLRYTKTFLIESRQIKILTKNGVRIIIIPNPIYVLLLHQIIFFRIKNMTPKFLKICRQKKLSISKIWDEITLSFLNKFNSLEIYTTISGFNKYPLEFYAPKDKRKYKTHVIHYSQNNIKIYYKDENIESPENEMINASSLGDIHWVWTPEYAHHARYFNETIEFKVVGSVMFRLPKSKVKIPKKNYVTIFDVTPPIKDRQGVHIYEGYYSTQNCMNFINDIVNTIKSNKKFEDYEINLKPKRSYDTKKHNNQYLDLISKLEGDNKIRLQNWETDPYELVLESQLIISIPFTSIAYLGVELGTNTIFYHPSDRELINPIYKDVIEVVHGISNLSKYLESKLTFT